MTPRRRPGTAAVVALPAAVAVALLALPAVALVVRAPLRRLPALLRDPAVLDALRVSLVVASLAALACLLLGVPLAVALARCPPRLARAGRALVTVPLVLPPVVAGVALLLALGRRGLLGRLLREGLGVTLPFTTAGAVVAAAFVALPFLVLPLEAALRSAATRDLDACAAVLGAAPLQRLRHVLLPSVAPVVASGVALAWARALGEFGATVTFAGSRPGVTQTLPLAVASQLETDPDAASVTSLVLVVVALVVLVLLRGQWPRPGFAGRPRG